MPEFGSLRSALLIGLSTVLLGFAATASTAKGANVPGASTTPSLGEALAPSSPEQKALSDHLRAKGAIFYGAWWCPACFQQKNLFGKEAGNTLPYVECDKTDPGRARCQAAQIRAYPTWDQPGKERREGVQTLQELKIWSGFPGSTPKKLPCSHPNRKRVVLSPACERNKQPLLALLQAWLPERARVLEIGSGSGQHAAYFGANIPALTWQASERQEGLATLRGQLAGLARQDLAPAADLPTPIRLDVTAAEQWPFGRFDAVFTANTCHIMPAAALPQLLAGVHQVLEPGGLLLLYGPFHDGGVHTAASNLSFDAHLRNLDPAMGVRDALELKQQALAAGLEPLDDVAMPANNRTLIFSAGPWQSSRMLP